MIKKLHKTEKLLDFLVSFHFLFFCLFGEMVNFLLCGFFFYFNFGLFFVLSCLPKIDLQLELPWEKN